MTETVDYVAFFLLKTLARGMAYHNHCFIKLLFIFQISESFRKFGMSDNDSSVFVVLINDPDNKVMNLLASKIQGTQSPIEDVKNLTDESLVRKVAVLFVGLQIESCGICLFFISL